MNSYIIKAGESIIDAVLNATGSLSNLDTVLSANNFEDWTPLLTVGQQIVIPDTVQVDANTLRNTQAYPVCNNSVNNILDLLNQVWSIMDGNWILTTGFWDDSALWIDSKHWIDSL